MSGRDKNSGMSASCSYFITVAGPISVVYSMFFILMALMAKKLAMFFP